MFVAHNILIIMVTRRYGRGKSNLFLRVLISSIEKARLKNVKLKRPIGITRRFLRNRTPRRDYTKFSQERLHMFNITIIWFRAIVKIGAGKMRLQFMPHENYAGAGAGVKTPRTTRSKIDGALGKSTLRGREEPKRYKN